MFVVVLSPRNELYSGIVDMHAQLHTQEQEIRNLRTEERVLKTMLRDKVKQAEVREGRLEGGGG